MILWKSWHARAAAAAAEASRSTTGEELAAERADACCISWTATPPLRCSHENPSHPQALYDDYPGQAAVSASGEALLHTDHEAMADARTQKLTEKRLLVKAG